MLIVAVFVFLMLRLTPADPAAMIAGDNATTEQVARDPRAAGPRPADRHAVRHLVQRDRCRAISAKSFFFKKQVTELIVDRLEPTLSLALLTIVIAVADRGAARRARRLPAWQLDRPHRHGLLGARFLGARVRHRLRSDLRLRHQARLAAGAGLPAHRRSASAAGCSG